MQSARGGNQVYTARMKNSPFFPCLIALLAVFAAVGAHASPADPAPSGASDAFSRYQKPASGEFVLYRDRSWKQPTWVGFLMYDENTYGALLVTPASGTRVTILFRVETADDRMILVGQKNILKPRQEDVPAVNYLMGLLPDIYAWRQAARGSGAKDGGLNAARDSSSLLPPAFSTKSDIASFGGAVTLTWAPEVTVFNLHSIRQSDGTPMLTLERMGRISPDGGNDFFTFDPPGDPAAGVALSVSATRARESKIVDGVRLNLDDQWTMIADNTFFLGNAALLVVDTLDLRLLEIPAEGLPLSLARRFSASSGSVWADPAEFSIAGTAARFRISGLFRDSESGRVNRDIKLCIPSPDGRRCTVVSLSVSETAYKANQVYFDSLF